MEAKVIQVIEVIFNRGLGVKDNPIRNVTAYLTLDGKLLAESDPITTMGETDAHS